MQAYYNPTMKKQIVVTNNNRFKMSRKHEFHIEPNFMKFDTRKQWSIMLNLVNLVENAKQTEFNPAEGDPNIAVNKTILLICNQSSNSFCKAFPGFVFLLHFALTICNTI